MFCKFTLMLHFGWLGRFIPQAVPLFIYAIRHTNLLAMALESKGFNPGSEQTFHYESTMRKKDYLVLSVLLILFGTALYLRLVLMFGTVIFGRL